MYECINNLQNQLMVVLGWMSQWSLVAHFWVAGWACMLGLVPLGALLSWVLTGRGMNPYNNFFLSISQFSHLLYDLWPLSFLYFLSFFSVSSPKFNCMTATDHRRKTYVGHRQVKQLVQGPKRLWTSGWGLLSQAHLNCYKYCERSL